MTRGTASTRSTFWFACCPRSSPRGQARAQRRTGARGEVAGQGGGGRLPPWIWPSCAPSTIGCATSSFGRARARRSSRRRSTRRGSGRWCGGRAAPDFILRRAEVRLDGDAIWDSGEKPLVDELIKVSERPIKPGTHTIALRLEVRPGKSAKAEHVELGYSSEHTFVVKVPDGKHDDGGADGRRRRRPARVRARGRDGAGDRVEK